MRFIDANLGLGNPRHTLSLFSDPVHLSAEGHRRVADRLAPEIEKLTPAR